MYSCATSGDIPRRLNIAPGWRCTSVAHLFPFMSSRPQQYVCNMHFPHMKDECPAPCTSPALTRILYGAWRASLEFLVLGCCIWKFVSKGKGKVNSLLVYEMAPQNCTSTLVRLAPSYFRILYFDPKHNIWDQQSSYGS